MTARLGLLLAALLVAGCDSAPDALLPVRGKVRYQGAALQGGIIVFTPDSNRGCHGALALAEIQPDGSYSLRTEKGPGTAAGWYRVTVAAVGADTLALPGHRYGVPSSLVPEKYRDPDLSRLVCQVKPDRANEIDFDLN